jgi:hypothetical protein
MKKIISESEVNQILSMHKSLKEQDEKKNTLDTTSDLVKLNNAITAGCLKGGKLYTNTDQTKYVYRATSKSGKTVDFTADMNYKFTDGSKSGKWKCDEIGKIEQTNTTSLNDNQRVSLKQLGDIGWSTTPKPTDVELDMGLYRKINLSDNEPEEDEKYPEESELVKTYNKYFMTEYPKGKNDFYVYKKTVSQPKAPGKIERVETPGKSCKTSIDNLYKHMDSPNTFPMTDNQKRADVLIAQRCAESANKKRFLLRFGLDKKLQLIARKYGIKLS